MIIESLVIQYLNDHLNVPAYGDVPQNAPSKFIIVEKTSGGRINQINKATLAVQSYAPTRAEAAELNETVKETMLGIVELAEIGGCHLNSDYNFTDTAKKQPRYQAVFNITHY